MGRIIEEDAVLNEIGRWIGYLDEDMIERIKIGIKKLPMAQRWIPCSERPPEENGKYLVTFHQIATYDDLGFDMDDTDVRKMYYSTESGWLIPKRFPSWINDAITSTVVAWMPLPEPWRGRE